MRIAHVAPVIYPIPPATYGGTERVIADLAAAQVQLGHDVTIFGPSDSHLPGIEMIGDYRSVAWHQSRMSEPLPPGFPAELEARQLVDLARDGDRFDIVHLHGSAHASGVCAALSFPAVRTIHWRADEPDHAEHFRAFRNERVVAISHSQAATVPDGNLAGVVHHGIPQERFRLERGPREHLAFIGRMTDQKRPDRAIALAQAAGVPIRLAGPIDPGNPTYFDRAVAPLLGDTVSYLGSLTDAEKQPFFGTSQALVFPIDWPEPFGLVMIEAMACGTPVIAWNKGSVPEVVEDGVTGIVVETLEEAIARFDEIRSLDPVTIRQRFEERFSASRMAADVLELYRAVSDQRSSSASSARSPSP